MLAEVNVGHIIPILNPSFKHSSTQKHFWERRNVDKKIYKKNCKDMSGIWYKKENKVNKE